MPTRYSPKRSGAPRFELAPPKYGAEWRKLRKRRLDADPLCVHCLDREHITPAVEVDHILPIALGGKDEWENTQSLCKPCHQAKTAEDMKLITRGY